GEGNAQGLQFGLRDFVNRHRLDFSILSVWPGDNRIQQRQILDGTCHWPNTGHDANKPGTCKARNLPGKGDAPFSWLKSKHTTKMRWDTNRSRQIAANFKWDHSRCQCRCRPAAGTT